MSETIKQIAETYARRVWDEKDLTTIDELISQKCVIHSLLGVFYGPSSMKTVVESWLTGFPDLKVAHRALIAEGDLVVVHWDAKGTHLGEFKKIKATGKNVSYSGVTIYRIANHQIVEYWAYLDTQQLMQQIL